ncbi:hypothetical protein BDV95DRAFT_496503 [Massariosphaeria phaeospora]|uniref:T6SS Phospholipase effector Tle1-like catalytic domain-containing protein n=1 Tax=Massariosphaeria phaeospora TaxID=100035 RepID=A0A7C8M8N0_9PLEO|nr:hypothetical protein BDV95DRAFT_496503 [Massariosphaeria phaeospora]
MALPTPTKHLLIFCDGTWCGRETRVPNAPPSNILTLASMIGEVRYDDTPGTAPKKVHPIKTALPNVTAGYQEGVGVNQTFLEYIWDGATASTIGEECTSVYKYIVENYTDDHEIWMFGFSRGAYTVRCVAGMINNCGIVKQMPDLSEEDMSTLCSEIYRTYRSTLDIDAVNSDRCTRLRSDNHRVWQARRPVRFMGLLDTVGSLGIPRLNAGLGFDWPEFYDQKISSVVQDVYHAPALHDRLWIFQPCLVFEGDAPCKARIHQQWLPGCHYDIGRQTFRFVRQSPANGVERLLGALPDGLSRTVFPNEVLSDVALRWMLAAVRDCDGTRTVLPDVERRIAALDARIARPEPGATGSGDIYGNVLDYAPAGALVRPLTAVFALPFKALNSVFPRLGSNVLDLLGTNAILKILTATRNRRVPGTGAELYEYKEVEDGGGGGGGGGVDRGLLSVEQVAGMREGDVNERGERRYPSRTYESFKLWRSVFGNGEV